MKRTLPFFALALCLLAAGLAGCAQKTELAGLALAGAPITMAPGSSLPAELAPAFTREGLTEEEMAKAVAQAGLVWASSDETVATVDENGVITAHAPGHAEVSVADAAGHHAARAAVHVVVPVESATAPAALTLNLLAGETAALDVAVLPANATGVVVACQSTDETVLAVSAGGTVIPVGVGEAEIITTVAGDGMQGRTEQVLRTRVTVALLPTGIALAGDAGILYVGHSHTLTPRTLPEEAPETSYTYTSSDETVATVDENGRIRAHAPGQSVITATSAEGHTAAYTVTVVRAPEPAAGQESGTPGAPAGEAPAGDGDNSGGSGGTGGNPYARPGNPHGDGSPGNPFDSGAGVGEGAEGIPWE